MVGIAQWVGQPGSEAQSRGSDPAFAYEFSPYYCAFEFLWTVSFVL